MTNDESIGELAKALSHISTAEQKAESEEAQPEIVELKLECVECIEGVVSDMVDHDYSEN